jgi:hypothetical protein
LIANNEALVNSEEGTAATTAETTCRRPSSATGQLDSIANQSGNIVGSLWTAGEQRETQPEKKKRKKSSGRRKTCSKNKKRKEGKELE